MDDDELYRRRRETLLVVSFAGIAVFGLLFVFTILTGGFLLYLILVVAVVAMIGGFHYLLWGRALTEQTAGDREEMEAEEEGAAREEGFFDETRRPRHY
jgi:fatty acid desaturase